MFPGPSHDAWGVLGSEMFSLYDPGNRGAEETKQKEKLALG